MIALPTPPGLVFRMYCAWLEEDMGGRVEYGENRHGGYAVLHSPDGVLCVVVPETGFEGLFASSLIEYLDSRLGLHSPWNQMPAEQEAADD